MTANFAYSSPQRRFWLYALLFWVACSATAAWSQDLRAPKQELDELRDRIESLERSLNKSQDTRDSALEAAKRTSAAIQETRRELEALAAKRFQVGDELAELQRSKATTESRVKAAQKRIAAIYYRNYVTGETPLAGRILSGENPNESGRRLQYASYLARAQSMVIGALREDLAELKRLRDTTSRKADQLAVIAREEKDQQARLQAQHQEQKEQVASLESRISKQRDTIEEYRRDEAKLTQLIQRLTQQAAAKKKREAERKRKEALAKAKREAKARAAAAAAKGKNARAELPPPPEPEIEVPAPVSGVFGKLKGRLAMPVAGELAHRFGSPRSEGGLSWKGVFFRAPGGTAVKAVAAGEVIFADWMRGFGQLLIIDHGDGYMSLYGNNDGLRKRVGDAVKSGEQVATVGGSGGNAETGLYFELRFRSQALNPLSWLAN